MRSLNWMVGRKYESSYRKRCAYHLLLQHLTSYATFNSYSLVTHITVIFANQDLKWKQGENIRWTLFTHTNSSESNQSLHTNPPTIETLCCTYLLDTILHPFTITRSYPNDLIWRRHQLSFGIVVWLVPVRRSWKEITARNVIGMTIQKDSWTSLNSCLPYDSCIMGKMRKTKRAIPQDYMTLKELTTKLINDDNPAKYHGFAVSRSPATTEQCN